MKGTLIVFVKAPVAGRVKTRLARDLGPSRAAALFRWMTRLTLREAAKGDWRTVIAVDPPAAMRGFSGVWPLRFQRLPQTRGDLGARMKNAFATAPGGPVIIIGADAPGIRAPMIHRAFRSLAGADAVFGPTDDGGYWLVGLARRRAAPDLFHRVRWSSKHALSDSIATLPTGFRIACAEQLRDVDDARDLAMLGSRAFLGSLARI